MKLYMAHVGFYEKSNGIYEIHSNIFVIAENIKDAKNKIKAKPIFIQKNMHIDGIEELVSVDGYKINVESEVTSEKNTIYHYEDIKTLT